MGVKSEDGSVVQVPLGEVATVRLHSGPSYIYRERLERDIPIKFSVRGRDPGGAVEEARARVGALGLPPGYRLEWTGQFGNLREAIARFQVIVPVTLLLIAGVLFVTYTSVTDTLLARSVIPVAMVGGVQALCATGTPFSVSPAVGVIALFGIAVMDGIIPLDRFNQSLAEGVERSQAILEACELRSRPVTMTCMAAGVGLLPAAFSTAIGSQVQRPLALVIVGGIMLAPAFILVVLPTLIERFSAGRTVDGGTDALAGQAR